MKFFNKQGSGSGSDDGTTRSSSNDLPFVLEFEDDGGTVHTEQASRFSSFTSPFSKTASQAVPPPTAPTKKVLAGFGSSSSSFSKKPQMRSISPISPIINSKKKGLSKSSNNKDKEKRRQHVIRCKENIQYGYKNTLTLVECIFNEFR